MHRAVAYRKHGATKDTVPTSNLVGPGMWSAVDLAPSPYVYDPAYKSSRRPLTVESRPAPTWTSHEYACLTRARTESYPGGSLLSRESATRFEDRPQSPETSSDDGSENGMDGDDDEVMQRRPTRVHCETEGDRYDMSNIYQRRADQDSVDDAESSAESESSSEQERPRAAISDIRSRPCHNPNSRVREYAPRGVKEPPSTACHPDVARKLPPSVRIVRPSASFMSSTYERESPTYEEEYTPDSASTSTSQFSTFDFYTERPPPEEDARMEMSPPPKRKHSEEVSDDTGAATPEPVKRFFGRTSGGRRRQYKCEICPNFYAGSKGDLKRHSESLVHKPPSYTCEMPPCGKKFTRLDALKRHMKNAHAPGKQVVKSFKSGHPKSSGK